jgi:hypothetical protein
MSETEKREEEESSFGSSSSSATENGSHQQHEDVYDIEKSGAQSIENESGVMLKHSDSFNSKNNKNKK